MSPLDLMGWALGAIAAVLAMACAGVATVLFTRFLEEQRANLAAHRAKKAQEIAEAKAAEQRAELEAAALLERRISRYAEQASLYARGVRPDLVLTDDIAPEDESAPFGTPPRTWAERLAQGDEPTGTTVHEAMEFAAEHLARDDVYYRHPPARIDAPLSSRQVTEYFDGKGERC